MGAQPGSRETKFGYGFLLVGAALPYLIDKLFGPVYALVAAAILLLAGIGCLVAAHLDREKKGAQRRYGLMETVAMFALVGASSGALIGSISGAIWKLASNRSTEAGAVNTQPITQNLFTQQQIEDAIRRATPLGDAPSAQSPKTQSDLAGKFWRDPELHFGLFNGSEESAQLPKFWFLVMDLTRPYFYPNAPTQPQSLPLQARVLNDFVRPKQTLDIEVLNEASRLHVQKGDKLFGIAWLTCLNCAKQRAYYFYYEIGSDNGWYSEAQNPPREFPGPSPVPFTDEAIQSYLDRLIPRELRMVIPKALKE
jgi:hypothetical protein